MVFMKGGLRAKEQLVSFAQSFLHSRKTFRAMLNSCPSFEEVWMGDTCGPLKECQERMELVAKCLLHLFCVDPQSYDRGNTVDADVLYFYQYKGQGMMEKAIRRLLTDPQTWYNKEVSDMISKGADSLLHQAKVEQLKALLKSSDQSFSFSALKQTTDLVKEVRGFVRSQRLATILGEFSDTWLDLDY